MTLPRWIQSRRWFIGGGLLAIAAMLVVFSLRCSPDAPPLSASAAFLSSTQSLVAPPASLFERQVPLSWGWLWRLREAVQGKREMVLIQAAVIECSDDAEQIWIAELGEPMSQTNGTRGWVADEPALRKLEAELAVNWKGKRVTSPRVTTAHGILAALWSGTSVAAHSSQPPVGLAMEVLSKAQGGGTELMTRVNFSESVTNSANGRDISIRTNLNGVACWQLPPGTGCVMLGPPRLGDDVRSAIFFSVKIERLK